MKKRGETMNNLAYQDDYKISEMIGGVTVMMSPRPRYEHVAVSGNIFFEFKSYLRGKTCKAFADGFDLYLDDKNRFIPDCMIVCDRSQIKHNGIYGAPNLVVEVLSRSTAENDRTKKKDAYARAGVLEYWIVDTWSKSVEVYYNHDNELKLNHIYYYLTDEEIAENDALPSDDVNKIETIDTEIKVSIFDDLYVKLKDIFEDI